MINDHKLEEYQRMINDHKLEERLKKIGLTRKDLLRVVSYHSIYEDIKILEDLIKQPSLQADKPQQALKSAICVMISTGLKLEELTMSGQMVANKRGMNDIN